MLLEHWNKKPPTHRLLAMFLEYGEYSKDGAQSAAPRSAGGKGFDFSPTAMQAFGRPCRQSELHPKVRKSVEQFQATPGYKAWREKLSKIQSERKGSAHAKRS